MSIKNQLFHLDRLDPNYPDPKGLRNKIAARSAIGSPTKPQTPSTPQPVQQDGASNDPASGKSSGSGSGCVAIALVVGGVFVVGGSVLIIGVALLLIIANMDSGTELGTGNVQVTLRWDGPADIDLEVVDPSGESISFENPFSVSGGELDVDANAGCEEEERNPVENISWPVGRAPTGTYEAHVYYFLECDGSGATDYEVTIRVDGQIVDKLEGTLLFEEDEALISRFSR